LDDPKASKRNQKLSTIVKRAARLAVEVSQQPYWFSFFATPPGEQFDPYYMEDVERKALLNEEGPDTYQDDRRVSLSIFPCVRRQEQGENGNATEIVINKAWVTVEMGDSQDAAENKDSGIMGEEAKCSVECG